MNPAYFKNSHIADEYLSQSAKLKPFFNQSLYPDWPVLAGNVRQNFRQTAILEELISQNADSDDPQINIHNKWLLQKNSVIVITGQQLGLMISPLYIIHKTISTIKLAQKLGKECQDYNFIPVFWLEGEDHDFEEVRSLNVLNQSSSLINISLEDQQEKAGFSINKRTFKEDINEVIRQLKDVLQPTDFSEQLFADLENIYQPGTNWLDAFKKHMSKLFHGSGLLYFNAGAPKIKQLSKPFFKQLIDENDTISDAFFRASSDLEKTGFNNQVNIQKDKAWLFYCPDGAQREPIFKKGDLFSLKSGKSFTKQQLLSEVDTNPEYFSSTVLTRPLWQSWLLPTVSYIAGAAEIAYWGQLCKAFQELSIIMPQVQPRHSITLVEPKTERLLKKYELDLYNITSDKSQFIKHFFMNNQLGNVNDQLNAFTRQIRESHQQTKELVKQIDPTLNSPVDKSYDAILGTVEKMQNRLSNRVKEKEATTESHLNAIHESVLPAGILQERMLSSLYFENKFGPHWVRDLMNKVDDNFERHFIVHLT